MAAVNAAANRRQAIETLHRSPYRCTLAVTGGGATAISDLLAVPGASQTLLEAIVPYHRGSLSQLLGPGRPWRCDRHTARMLAGCCYQRATRIAESVDKELEPALLLGVGCTAALTTDRPKRGAHRVHLAIRGRAEMREAQLDLTKGARTREEEERVASDMLLHELMRAAEIDSFVPSPLLVTDRFDRRMGALGGGMPRL